MKDITNTFMKQEKGYGRPANLKVSRLDIYKNKMYRMYKLLGKKKQQIVIMQDGVKKGYCTAELKDAKELVEELGKWYFLDIKHTDVITVYLTEELPMAVIAKYLKQEEDDAS